MPHVARQVARWELTYTEAQIKSIQHEYNAVLDMAARLTAFAMTLPFENETDVNLRQEKLASEDLVRFAVHARRFITILKIKSAADEALLPHLTAIEHKRGYDFVEGRGRSSVWEFLGIVVHNVRLQFVRHGSHFWPPATKGKDVVEIMKMPNPAFRPKVIIQSDRSDLVFIDLHYFMKVFLERVLSCGVDKCAEQQVFLEDWLFD